MSIPRLDEDAKRALEAAATLARRHQHDFVDPEHTLFALLSGGKALAIGGVSRPELLARLDALLCARPRSAVYRDVDSQPSLSSGLSMVLRRAAAGRGLSFFRAVTAQELLIALLAEPGLAALVQEARIEREQLDAVLSRARKLANDRRHQVVTLDHVLSSLLDAPSFVSAVEAVGGDAARLGACLEQRLASQPRSATGRRARFSAEVDEAAKEATLSASSVGRGDVRVEDFVLKVLRATGGVAALVEADISSLLLMRYLASGHVDAGDDALESDDARLEVVFHNDDATTMDFVVRVLKQCFDVPETLATILMRRVHEEGSATIGVYEAADARRRVARARATAATVPMPLRMSLRPLSGAGAGVALPAGPRRDG